MTKVKPKPLSNLAFTFREARTILSLSGLSSLLSIISLTLIFFVAILAGSSWWLSSLLVDALKNEAEISVYYAPDLGEAGAPGLEALVSRVGAVEGVRTVKPVSAAQAFDAMSEILGTDASVLTHFQENPFEAYLEVGVDLGNLAALIAKVQALEGVDYVRDNQSILEKVASIARLVTGIAIFVAAAVGTATLIVTAHIVREGVHANREQIMTLKLLGAPNGFIYRPFLLEGVLITTAAGLLASLLFWAFARSVGPMATELISFLPPFQFTKLLPVVTVTTLCASALLGLTASLLGLGLVRNHGMRV
ncbi:cell division protein FtsX [Acidaminobacter hydrogenoformans]|uniref:Cell division protein FtsX n=1 Tax=Acidaminobacter hydrogenoformans DSM 2784 TaxID=1120920 RepID=A0A1G5RVU7_9FIRM|nr:permease-like cell division protein FtsX [Acidaminobacter hydrogenoformans]SCZ78166.1 cell division protein FtsX [Acidaminobacter hydrogenoformans DSM 2784]